jgi:hypothetical protein
VLELQEGVLGMTETIDLSAGAVIVWDNIRDAVDALKSDSVFAARLAENHGQQVFPAWKENWPPGRLKGTLESYILPSGETFKSLSYSQIEAFPHLKYENGKLIPV